MVSIHWSSSTATSHTATFSTRSGAVWVSVTTYAGDNLDPCRTMEGSLDSCLPKLTRVPGRYELGARHLLAARRLPESEFILDAVRAAMSAKEPA